MKVPNYKGKMVEAPADLYQHVATLCDHYLVWSRKGSLHQVRYGLHVETFEGEDAALYAVQELTECMIHYVECNGVLGD